jgi:AraC-like DNA-binding protein
MIGRNRHEDLNFLVAKYSKSEGMHETEVAGLRFYKISKPCISIPSVYNPSLCIVTQGRKQVMLEDETYYYSTSEFLAVSVDLPVIGQVTDASQDKPYLSLQIDLDPRHMSDLLAQIDDQPFTRSDAKRGLFVGKLDETLMDCVLRLTRLLDTPKDIPALAPMITREIHYRLLSGEHGPTVAQMGVNGSTMQRIAQVIQKMKSDISKPIRIEELAEIVNMSPSSFHSHFKRITTMSPLQYYKCLRLTTARQIMLTEEADATSTAYRVGYESPAQFSREYARMFGAPPMRDIKNMRHSNVGLLFSANQA